MRVVDLGGRWSTWAAHPPAGLTVVNLHGGELKGAPGWVDTRVGDVCDPALLAGESFDLVFSNSVLEHVGGHARRQAMADTVHRLGPRHWVQTPYRYFPVEPHFLFPGLQWLPRCVQARALEVWPLGQFGRTPRDLSVEVVLEVELVSVTELRHYFPTSRVWRERVGPFVKSLTAVRA